jgi:23S rRNA (guanine2445-N2)-methyltransferase / 23S rRNA (guanine2069-N7)-methyltransferase
MSGKLTFFATCPKGVEDLLSGELRALGAEEVRTTLAGVGFTGSLGVAFSACLWSRVAGRILLPLSTFPVQTADDLYDGVRMIPWEDHMNPSGTLAVDAGVSASALTHSGFTALKTKDAVVDRFRDRSGKRPSVRVVRPDVKINVHVHRDRATVSLDLSGESLHLRGYRMEKGEAPLRENLASAILLRAGWAQTAAMGHSFIDPMCGSGTLPIEAAFIAGDMAPGLRREYYGFLGWNGFDRDLWRALLVEARFRADEGVKRLPPISGCDSDTGALRIARRNLKRAGLEGKIPFDRKDIRSTWPARESEETGIVVVNPPYGERLGAREDLRPLYKALGNALKTGFPGWTAALFTGNPELGKEMGLKAHKKNVLFNGPIRCELLHFRIRGPIQGAP